MKNNNNSDLVSVIIPTYNREHLIKRSAQSVLNQSYKNLELIIVDDGSTDNTRKVVDSIKDERIIYINQKNQGACVARNKGIDNAKGKYIAFQDSDDVWLSDKLEKQVNALKQNNADLVFCKNFIFGNLRKKIVPSNFKTGFLEKGTIPYGIRTQTILGKSDIFLKEKFDVTLPRFQEFELLLRIQKKYSIYCLDEAEVNYFVQKDSISRNPEKLLNAWNYILNKHKNLSQDYSKSLDTLATSVLYDAFNVKDKKIKSNLFNIAFKFSNSRNTRLHYLFHKFHVYKTRELMVKSITIPTKKVIKTFRKVI